MIRTYSPDNTDGMRGKKGIQVHYGGDDQALDLEVCHVKVKIKANLGAWILPQKIIPAQR